MLHDQSGPGPSFLAVTWAGSGPPSRWATACEVLRGGHPAATSTTEDTGLCVVGAGDADVVDEMSGKVLLHLTRGARVGDRDVTDADLTTWLSRNARHPGLDDVLPPFAALHRAHSREPLRLATDYLGFRSVYVASADGWAALSTSTKALATLADATLDTVSLACFSLIGWRIGDRTHFAGVRTLPPGSVATLRGGEVTLASAARPTQQEPYGRLEDAAAAAADLLRTAVNAMVEDHPSTWLQLTGGLDSRILLGAVDPRRRRHLQAMTLSSVGNPDADIAASLASRLGLGQHHVVPVSDSQDLSPEHASRLVSAGAHRLDYAADPLAWAALSVAEASVPQHPRLAGLGGEVVRGFYYLGPVVPTHVTHRRITGLARWRLFPNETVPDDILVPDLAASRRDTTLAELDRIFDDYPGRWHQATDDFYLWQRMQRWAGVTTTSTVYDRLAVNPMLDPRFMAIGRRVPPRWRARMRFLASVMTELDADLARLPLDGRPAPEVYARPTPLTRAQLGWRTADKVGRKVAQRLGSTGRPAVGSENLADLVLRHWRSDPSLLAPVAQAGVVRSDWLEQVLTGASRPSTSAIGFVATLAAAGSPVTASPRQQGGRGPGD